MKTALSRMKRSTTAMLPNTWFITIKKKAPTLAHTTHILSTGHSIGYYYIPKYASLAYTVQSIRHHLYAQSTIISKGRYAPCSYSLTYTIANVKLAIQL